MPRDSLCLSCHRILKGFLAPCRYCLCPALWRWCYNVLVGSRVSRLSPWLGCGKKALFCALQSPGRACCSIDFWEASGFLLMTRSSLLPDSAMSGTTRQQSKSLVRTWLTCQAKKSHFQWLVQPLLPNPEANGWIPRGTTMPFGYLVHYLSSATACWELKSKATSFCPHTKITLVSLLLLHATPVYSRRKQSLEWRAASLETSGGQGP